MHNNFFMDEKSALWKNVGNYKIVEIHNNFYVMIIMGKMDSNSTEFKNECFRSSLMVWWLGFSTFTTVAQVQPLIWELRYHIKPLNAPAGKKKKKVTV